MVLEKMLSSVRNADVFLSKKPWLAFIFFIILVVFLRWSSFYQSVISWDESLYLLVAKAWSNGNPPYTTVWDNKPPGIYAIFLTAISILGHSVLSIRILACFFVATTCFFLYKIGGLIEHNGKGIGLLAGGFYAVATLNNGGIAANTEIFYSMFVVAAFYLFFSKFLDVRELSSSYYLKLLLIGFLLGIGFEIKYVVLFDFLALFLILIAVFILRIESSTKYRSILQASSLISLGFVLPFIIVSLYFWLIGHFDDYVYANFTANKLRTVGLEFSITPLVQAIAYQVQTNKFFWLSIPSAAIYLFIAKPKSLREKWVISGFIVWFFVIILGICAVFRGYLYIHYFLQLSPALCFITAYVLIRLIFFNLGREAQSEFRQYLILAALLIILLDNAGIFGTFKTNVRYAYFTHIKGIKHWQDTPALIAEYLKPNVKPNDYIYVVDNAPIVYFLVDAKIPTRYAFPPFLLIRPDLPNITGVNSLEELERILQKQPTYIIKPRTFQDLAQVDDNKNFINRLNQALEQSYRRETSIQEFDLYRLGTKS
ncbi:MAG: glycosyltransferase family 39 protein [Oscillatoriales cyanobacterium C42_A2020_001]|nr:glycosyltransferase family 39 protein [Leptolyngbyaceae cyanobacterium C42_A2020_001]